MEEQTLALASRWAVIYILDLFNNKISDKKEFVKSTKAPFLGTIGISKDPERIVVREGNTTPIAEMFRMIKQSNQSQQN